MRQLLLGCGNRRVRHVCPTPGNAFESDVTTVDIDPGCGADHVVDLNQPPPWYTIGGNGHILAGDCTYEEVHAYEVLEHIGRQGCYHSFFETMYEIYRILTPGGHLCASVPALHSPWLWGDPGHRRVISRETLIFLDRTQYAQVGHTAMTDYRSVWRGDFELVYSNVVDTTYWFALKAHKPSRC